MGLSDSDWLKIKCNIIQLGVEGVINNLNQGGGGQGPNKFDQGERGKNSIRRCSQSRKK